MPRLSRPRFSSGVPARRNTMRFLFRCDGGKIPEYGTGHIARCLLLADKLKERGHAVFFAVARDEFGVQKIKSAGYPCFILKQAGDFDAKGVLKVIGAVKADVVVIDRLDTAEKYMRAVKKTDRLLITMDDRGSGASLADIRINGMLPGGDTPYQGCDYVILPLRQVKRKKILKKCARIFVSFGGYDHHGLIPKTLQAIKKFKPGCRFVVVAGNNHKDLAQEGMDGTIGSRVRIYGEVKDFDRLVENCDMAILSGGLSLYQALSFGIPSLVISQYPHQLETAQRLARSGAAISLGPAQQVAPDTVRKAAEKLAGSRELRADLSRKGQLLIDRNGVDRVTDIISVVQFLKWDTDFFKKRIARLCPSRINEKIVDMAFKFCRDRRIDCLYYLADSGHSESVKIAEQHGFHFVDIRLTFGMDLRQQSFQNKKPAGLKIRDARLSDIPHLRLIAGSNYELSRYYFDRHFSKILCSKFYSDWISKACKGGALKVLVATVGGEIAGYVTCEGDDDIRGRLSLVGVSGKFHGRGIGRLLVQNALQWFKEQGFLSVEVVTQGRNYGAQRLYQRCGFTTLKTQLWYHKWFNSRGGL